MSLTKTDAQSSLCSEELSKVLEDSKAFFESVNFLWSDRHI